MTALFDADALTHATGGTMTRPFHVSGISIDTRTIQPGDLFVALKTATGDGHAHVQEALQRAAGGLVHTPGALPDGAPLLLVHNTQHALEALGEAGRRRFQGSVAAITGSVGKTTVKEMLRIALSACGATHAADASYNNHWGVPLTLARMPEDAAFAVVEIGMNHPGEISPLSILAAPDVAVITTIGTAHIGNMGSPEAIADEKACILAGVLPRGVAVLPADSPFHARLAARVPDGVRRADFSRSQITLVAEDAAGSDLEVALAGQTLRFRLNVPGRHMALNALAALTAAHALGADPARCAAALEGFAPVAGRGVRKALLGGKAVLLDESYNASTASVQAALRVLGLQPATRRIAVLGDMLEMGAHRDREHAALATAVRESADLLYACGDGMKILYDALPAELRGAHTPTSADLAPVVVASLRAGDVVLVKGSLGSRMRVVVDALEKAGG